MYLKTNDVREIIGVYTNKKYMLCISDELDDFLLNLKTVINIILK